MKNMVTITTAPARKHRCKLGQEIFFISTSTAIRKSANCGILTSPVGHPRQDDPQRHGNRKSHLATCVHQRSVGQRVAAVRDPNDDQPRRRLPHPLSLRALVDCRREHRDPKTTDRFVLGHDASFNSRFVETHTASRAGSLPCDLPGAPSANFYLQSFRDTCYRTVGRPLQARAEGLEPPTAGFGIRCSAN